MPIDISRPRFFILLVLILVSVVVILVNNSLLGSSDIVVNDKVFYAIDDYVKEYARARPVESRSIGILTIIEATASERDYIFALETMRCYADLQGYDFRVVRDSQNWTDVCGQRDFMFKRHCIVAHLIDDHEWTLVIDADIGVINPSKLIESWNDDRFDVILYDRFFNWEVATGSYLVKRSNFGKEFLLGFADYEHKLPKSFHGTDNAAIHAFLVEILAPYAKSELEDCRYIWERSKSYTEIFQFETCVRVILGSNREFPPKVKIQRKGTGWVRDGWLTESQWSENVDFMFHGWQLRRLLNPFGNSTRHPHHESKDRDEPKDDRKDGKEEAKVKPQIPSVIGKVSGNFFQQKKRFSCVFCGNDHFSAECTQLTSLEERVVFLTQDDRCFVCLQRHGGICKRIAEHRRRGYGCHFCESFVHHSAVCQYGDWREDLIRGRDIDGAGECRRTDEVSNSSPDSRRRSVPRRSHHDHNPVGTQTKAKPGRED